MGVDMLKIAAERKIMLARAARERKAEAVLDRQRALVALEDARGISATSGIAESLRDHGRDRLGHKALSPMRPRQPIAKDRRAARPRSDTRPMKPPDR